VLAQSNKIENLR